MALNMDRLTLILYHNIINNSMVYQAAGSLFGLGIMDNNSVMASVHLGGVA